MARDGRAMQRDGADVVDPALPAVDVGFRRHRDQSSRFWSGWCGASERWLAAPADGIRGVVCWLRASSRAMLVMLELNGHHQ